MDPLLARRYGLMPQAPVPAAAEPSVPTSPTLRLAPLSPADSGPRFDFEFDHAPLSEVLRGIQESFSRKTKGHLSFVIPEVHQEFVKTTLVTIQVRQVTIVQFLELLEKASLRATGAGNSHEVDPNTGMVTEARPALAGYGFLRENEERENPIWMFYNDLPATPVAAASPATQCRFFNLAPFLDDLKVEDITTVIRAGWEMMGNPNAAKFLFHKETGMLVVVGAPRDLSMIDDVLDQLKNGRAPGRPRRPSTGVAPDGRTK